MSVSLDLNLMPVARYAGREYPELLSLHTAEAPRRAARGREDDRLILYLVMSGNALLAPGKQEGLLGDMARLYYDTPGSVTSAMRRVADEMNRLLLDRNLQLASSSRQALGTLTQVVVRGQQLYLAQSGPAHAFLITASETQYYNDAEMDESALGQGRAAPVVFYQAALQANDTLLLAVQPPGDWSPESLSNLHGQGPESLRRRLFHPGVMDLNAVLIQARPGKGKFYLPRPGRPSVSQPAGGRPAPPSATAFIPAKKAVSPESPVTTEIPIAAAEAAPLLEILPSVSDVAGPEEGASEPVEAPAEVGAASAAAVSEQALTPGAEAQGEPAPAAAAVEAGGAPAQKVAETSKRAGMGAALAAGAGRAAAGLGRLISRLWPREVFAGVPSYVMAFVALAVPVVIVTLASLSYFRLGRQAQFELYFSQAQQMAARGIEQTEVSNRRADLETSIQLLDKAEKYGTTAETRALRGQIRNGLDGLDLVKRIFYQPAIVGGLPATVVVTRIVPADDDLYLLDSSRGSVIRASITPQGYELDMNFQCGPSAAGGPVVGPIIDIAAWPAGFEPAATLLAMDAEGNVLYCRKDEAPLAAQLSKPDVENWGKIAGFTLDLGDAYVLDRPSNGVWIYWRSNFMQEPALYFNAEIPTLEDVLDLAVTGNDLYLLHVDGRVTLCVYSNMAGVLTRCTDIAFVDTRSGREGMPMIPAAPFAQLQYTAPPDPSLFFLQPADHGAYHYSLRNLAFQRMYLPDEHLSSRPATAFAVDTLQRYLYLAIGNEVYYAVMP
jgi:hypothetical protein